MTLPPHAPRPGVTGVLLTGGGARRLGGREKAFLDLGGETLFERTRAVLEGLFGPVLVVTDRPEPFERYGVRTVADVFPGCGPLAGLHAALRAVETEAVFLAACDLPHLDPRVVERIVSRAGGADAVVPHIGGRSEPLHALYARRAAATAESCLREGRRSMEAFLGTLSRVTRLTEDAFEGIEGFERSFTNVNDPEGWTREAWEAREEGEPG
jgi:molybdopterin-guanine dinucleotide biosynthesis protein A